MPISTARRIADRAAATSTAIGGALLCVAPAWADDLASPLLTPATSAAALAVGALAAVAAMRFRALFHRARTDRVAAENRERAVRQALVEAGAAFWHLDGSGQVSASDNLSAMLGQDAPPGSFDSLAGRFDPESAGAFKARLANGGPLAIDLATVSGRHVTVQGRTDGKAASFVFLDAADHRATLDRALAEKAQAENEAALRQRVLDGLPLAAWQRDGDLNIVWANATMAAQLETTVEAIVRERIEYAASFDRSGARALAQKAVRNAGPQMQLRSLVVAGERRRFRIVETPFGGGTLGVALDATEEEALRAELKRHITGHAEVLQNLATAICVWDADRRLVLHNRAFARLWRLDDNFLEQSPTYGELLEHLREQRKLPEQADWAHWKRARQELFTTVLEPREELMHLPDERTLRVVTTPHPFGGLLMTYEDVTNQLVLERARNTLAAVQRATLDNLYEGVAVFGDDGRLKLSNSGFTRIWGVAESALEGEPHIDTVIDLLRPLLGDGGDWERTRSTILVPFHNRERTSGRIETTAGPVVDYATVPLPDGAVLFTFWDVTDSVNVERVLTERNQALQAADQLKSEFIANVSHELRTPLNTVIGFGEILVNQYFGEMNERQREYAEGIVESSHILLHLIDDILDLATIEAGHMALAPKPIDVHFALDGVVRLARHRAREKQLSLDLDCPEDIGSVVADERRIRQVLFNLVSNAIKFTPTGGGIVLGARKAGDQMEIWVSDTGIGIPDDERHIVFDRFAKGRAGQRQTGAGLGLALVKSFVELHGGRVELDPATSKGTTVRCYLPLAPARAA